MNDALAKEVAAMLNIEAGAPIYRVEDWSGTATVYRDVSPGRAVTIDGYGTQLKVDGPGHPRGFRFVWRADKKPEERFDWKAIHMRCSQLADEMMKKFNAGR